MLFKQGMSLIITMVDEGFSSQVIKASKFAGAEGATILQGRGTSIHENETFMGVDIQPGKEIILIMVRKSQRKNIMKEIVRVCNLSTQGKGMTFAVPIDEVAGVPHLLKKSTEEKPVAQNNTVKSETPKEEKQNN